jgi:hypothetical protein
MTDRELADIEGIRRTIAQYAHFCDDGQFDEWGQLFTDDATFSVLGEDHEGRAAAQAFIEKVQGPEQRGKHICVNSVIDLDGDRARAWTDYIFIDKTKAITSAGRYHDTLVRDDERWCFRARRIVFLGEDA